MGGGDPGAAAIFLGGAHVREDGGRAGFVHRGRPAAPRPPDRSGGGGRGEARVPAEEAAETAAETAGGGGGGGEE